MSNWLTSTESFKFKAQLALFKLSHPIDHFSMFLAITSMGIFLFVVVDVIMRVLFGLSFLLYMVQKYYAMRIYYDVALFEAWGSVEPIDLDVLDQVLHAQFGVAASQQSLANRLLGVRQLFNKQGIVVGLQLLILIASLVVYLV